jgi:hypothetical protein
MPPSPVTGKSATNDAMPDGDLFDGVGVLGFRSQRL